MADIITNASVAVVAGSGTRTITGVFGAGAYVVRALPSWVTALSVTAKTATSFIVTFGTAPAADGTLDYAVIGLD